PEGALGLYPLRCLLGLRVVSERDASEDLARALAGLRWCEPFSGAERDAPGPTVGAILRNIGASSSLQPQPETRKFGVPGERFALPLPQRQGSDSLYIQSQFHVRQFLGST